MSGDQSNTSSTETNKPRRKLPRGCRWLIIGAIVMMALCCSAIVGGVIYVDACGFPYLSTVQTESTKEDRGVISAKNASRLTELIIFNDGEERRSIDNMQPRRQALFSPSGKWLASGGAVHWGSGYSCSSIWLINTQDFSSQVFSLGENRSPRQLLFSPDEKWLFAASYSHIEAISPTNTSDRYTIADPSMYAGSDLRMTLMPGLGDSNVIMIYPGNHIPVYWDYIRRRDFATPLEPDIVTSVERAGDYIAYGTADGDIKLYQYHVSENKTTKLLETEYPVGMSFNHAGTLLSVNDRRTSKVFDVATKEIVFEVPSYISTLLFSPTDRYGVTDEGLWTLEDQKQHLSFKRGHYWFARFSPNEDLLIMATYEGLIDIWDLNTYELVASIDNDYQMSSISFSPDQTLIAASFGGKDGLGTGLVKFWGVPLR